MVKITRFISLILVIILCVSFSGCTQINVTDTVTEAPTTNAPDTNSDTTKAEPEPEPQKTSVNIRMVGDVLLHERVTESGKNADGSFNYDHFFAHVSDEIKSADIALVNQEVILGGSELGLSGYPAFNGPYEVGDALVKTGFDVILHATNHALDRGSTAVRNCLSFWQEKHPDTTVLGINDSYEMQDTVYITEVNGIKFAILNYTYGTNGIPMPADMPYAVNLLDESKIAKDVQYAEANADFTIVCPHWGTEYTHQTDSNQQYWTNYFFSLGVDLVIGTHPHVIEPVEMIDDGQHKMLVYYSLGNFINSTAETGAGVADRMVGAMSDVTVTLDESGNAVISDYGVIPLITHVADGKDMTTYLMSDYTDALAGENLIVYSDSAFSYGYCKNLAETVFGDLIR